MFLGAAKHLYKKVCPSVHPSVRPSVRPSVHLSIGRSVGPLRLLIFGGFGVLRSTAWPVLTLVFLFMVYIADMAILMSNFEDFDKDQIS